jgi:hypothetical protein
MPRAAAGESRGAQAGVEHARDPHRPALPVPRPVPGDVVAGCRLVRLLGSGAHGAVFLGIPTTAVDDAAPEPVAVKLYHPTTTDETIGREIDALSRIDHPHLERLLDVALDPDGRPCLLLERLTATTLADLVCAREPLDAGEAVTVLAPVAGALDAMHSSGVMHGTLRLRSVLFRESGAPVVRGFGHASLIPPGEAPAHLTRHEGVLLDRRALSSLVATVLESAGVVPGIPSIDEAADDYGTRLADRLFELAEPRPLRLRRDAPGAERALPSRAALRLDPERPGRSQAPAATVSARRRHAAAPATAGAPLERGGAASIAARINAHARVRPRFWATAAGVGVAVVLAAAVVPGGGSPPSPSGQGPSSPAGQASAVPGQASPPDGSPLPPVAEESDPTQVDDPLVALPALLEQRERCVRDASVLCLDLVAQPGSAAMEHDTALIRRIQAGGELPGDEEDITAGTLTLVERLGDSALVDLGAAPHSTTASTLMMRGEAGWRIRDYLGR